MTHIFKDLISVSKAKKIFLDSIKSISKTEKISILKCVDRVLATHVISPRNVPHFRRAAMDGYAVKAADTVGASAQNPIVLQISDYIEEGTCTKISTGHVVPDEYDTVIMLEDTSLLGNMLEIRAQVYPGKNVGKIGEDIQKNEIIFNKGHLIRACDIAVLISLGICSIEVYLKPVVSIIPVGNNLLPFNINKKSDLLPPIGYNIDTNSLMIGLYVEKWGGIPLYHSIIPETVEDIQKSISDNINSDMIIISGGTSVGEKDLVPSVVKSMGNLLVHGVNLNPGKPTALGIINSKPVLCIPGFPAAGLVVLFVFGKNALQKIANIPQRPQITIKRKLSSKITSKDGYLTYARVVLDNSSARPIMTAGAGILSSITKAQGFVIIPENIEGYEQYSQVDVTIID